MGSSVTFARRTRIMLVLFAGLASAVSIAACRDATQIDLELTSNVCLPGRTSYAVTVVDPQMKTAVEALRPPADSSEPALVDLGSVFQSCDSRGGFFDLGSATVLPSSENRTVLVQLVLGMDGQRADECKEAANNPKCVFARRRIGFVAHRRVTVPIFLDGLRCAGKDCNEADKTCFAGGCVSATADRCADGTCLTEAEQANGGAVPNDAPKPSDGGFELPDGATVGPDGAPGPVDAASDANVEDVGVGEGSADGSTSMDSEPPSDASTSCLMGTGLGCGSSQFSGADGGFIPGNCCARPGTQPATRSCEHPFMPCGGGDPYAFEACFVDADCAAIAGTTCRREAGQAMGICGVVTSCVPSADGGSGVGRGSGCAMASASFNSCCLPAFDCVKREPGAQIGVCLGR